MDLIQIDQKTEVFHLSNKFFSYIMEVEEEDILTQLYYGKKIRNYNHSRSYPRLDRSFSPNFQSTKKRNFSIDTVLQEYSGYGRGDFRMPAQIIQHSNGSKVTDFRFHSYKTFLGKPKLDGLPATYVVKDKEAETLIITLKDKFSNVYADLSYTIYRDRPVLTRSIQFRNKGKEKVVLEKAASMNLDFAEREFNILSLSGAWAREREIVVEKIETGMKVFDSKRGSSSHQQNPFTVLMAPDATESQGEVFAFCLVYSGNHETVIERDQYNQTRVTMGINSFNFSWNLMSGEIFQTPEVVMVYSDSGLNNMSHAYHDLFKERLTRGQHQYEERPVLVNNWEATYFNFDEEKIIDIVSEADELGIELFVLDDGWFGHRDDDNTSLGDWFEYRDKLKNGLKGVADIVHGKGMKFGLWFEPEMISEDSKLYKEHPDWAMQIPGRELSPARGQYVLDFSRKEIRDNIYKQIKRILDETNIDYIKWDMNRNMTEVYSKELSNQQQGEVSHRYMLGLYEFLEKLTSEYPNILFESCSGGGGRFDAGMLYYMPQTWTSDNTDAIARLNIQYGTSLVYPLSTMGSHISSIPNHQTGRLTNLKTRGNVAMSGVFGYELDLTKLTIEEKSQMREQITFYKKNRKLLQFGDFYRLESPFDGNTAAWMIISKDKKEAIVFFFRILAKASAPLKVLKLQGLMDENIYQLIGTNQEYGGDELMQLGLYIDPYLKGDFASEVYYFVAKS
jgi:alpha-galactosidase